MWQPPDVAKAKSAATAACVIVLSLCASCAGTTVAAEPGHVARDRQFIVVVDLSGSRTVAEIEADKRLIGSIIYDLRPSDKLVLLRVAGTGALRTVKSWTQTMPEVRNREKPTLNEKRRIEATRDDASRDTEELFAARGEVSKTGTDLFATLFAVRDHVLEAGGRESILVVLSDMIQEADGINLAKNPPPDGAWISKRKADGLVPELKGVCVSIVGPDMSTAQGAAILKFWNTYFGAADAQFAQSRYRRSVTQVDSVVCSGT